MGHFFTKTSKIIFFSKKVAHSANFLMTKNFLKFLIMMKYIEFCEKLINIWCKTSYFTLWDNFLKKRPINYIKNRMVTIRQGSPKNSWIILNVWKSAPKNPPYKCDHNFSLTFGEKFFIKAPIVLDYYVGGFYWKFLLDFVIIDVNWKLSVFTNLLYF
jgi:hypothetical protein